MFAATRLCLAITCLLLCPPAAFSQVDGPRLTHDPAIKPVMEAWLKGQLPALEQLYQKLHRAPELSLQEQHTAAAMADELRKVGFEVTTGVGGHGVVALLKNGKGKTLMLRADMDGLPVTETTGLAYASQVRVQDEAGRQVGVMHACGHDIHMANMVGTARFLASHRQMWAGTLMIVMQPAEELGRGSRAMLEDGLFLRFARPHYTLALHVDPDMPAGTVGYVAGWAAANVDSADITIPGRSGHGARPHQANDPVVTAAHLVTALQTLVSRRVDPQSPAVVTVGSIHGGTKHNLIPDQVTLQLTIRSYDDQTRATLRDGIVQLAADVCRSHGCPAAPDVKFKDHYTPAVYNDPGLAEAAGDLWRAALGEQALFPRKPTMGGEDFGRYSRALGVPSLLFRLGTVAPRTYKRSLKAGAKPLPSLHSSAYAPAAAPSLHTGVIAMGHLALALLAK